MNRAIGYTRISTVDQSNYSLPWQEDCIRQYCANNKLECIKIFEDNGRSAKNFDRPNWKALEKFISDNHDRVDILLVAKYDRFSRNVAQSLQMIELLENRYQVRIVSVMENIGIHPQSPYFFKFRTDILTGSQMEWLVIKDRTRAGIRKANKSGRWINNAPLGYLNKRNEKNEPIIVIDETRAPYIEKVFQLFLDGMPPKAIARQVNCKEFNVAGNGGITRILSNPLYAGMIRVPAGYDDPEDLVKGIHDPIVSEITWWKVQSILSKKGSSAKLIYNDNFPLRGLLQHQCGKMVTAAFSQGKTKKVGYYRCMADNKNLNAGMLHQQMDEILKELSLPEFYVDYMHQALLKTAHDDFAMNKKTIEEKKRELAQLQKKMDNIQEDRSARIMDAATYTTWMYRYKAERSMLESEIADMSRPVNQMLSTIHQTLPLLTDFHGIYHRGTTPQKQSILRGVFERGLSHDAVCFRTPWILPVFDLKAAAMAEKRLLIVEKPMLELDKTASGSPYERSIEPLHKLLAVLSQISKAS